jgi:hypothetical protein
MSSHRFTRAAAAAVAGIVTLGAGVAIADPPADPPADTTMSVFPSAVVAAPVRSPLDFPGVPGAVAGRPLPKGYVVVARAVRITVGGETAFAALRMTCPKGKTWRTAGAAGDIAVSVLDRRIAGKRSVLALASAVPQVGAGGTATGTVYALCR